MTFRTPLAEAIFRQKYMHESCETWGALARTLAHDVCGRFLPRSTVEHIALLIEEMKFIPGGRYLYYAGREIKAFQNCLSGDTRVVTSGGLRRLDSFTHGEKAELVDPVTGRFVEATMLRRGEQSLQRVTFAPLRGKSRKRWEVLATRTHHWPLVGGGDTYDLRVGDLVPAGAASIVADPDGFEHGFVFGDGGRSYDGLRNHFGHSLRLCGRKDKHVDFFEARGCGVTYPPSANGDPVVYVKSSRDLKLLPDIEEDGPGYVAGFIEGWLAADGHHGETCQIHSTNEAAIDWFVAHAPYAGLVVTGEKGVETRPSNFGERKPLYRVNFTYVGNWQGFKVVAIEHDVVTEVVYCPDVPGRHRFVLESGIDTFNCYVFISQEDTREDWADLSWKAESSLALGGGLGNDYSVYRAKDTPLKRTGGVASGPVSKMRMINEIGREVRQGGSRRSALYGSLRWSHPDARELLFAKDWEKMRLPGTDLTLKDMKERDFNFPAPLDQTNVSLNYDTAWAEGERLNETFLTNVAQALRTGEPGFSFNLWDKERETGRNACTEFTSADDADVCNIGSLNLSRIADLHELEEVTALGSMFLLCGTLVSTVPFEKVRQVRDKNRKIGLGLMGVHEWLLQRGERYEVTPELHRWLEVYERVSDRATDALADHLGVGRPVSKRAIAPTGTIGMIAGTTTGIEPLFAVAYKRRYLKNGTEWHYQYTVDGTAKLLIDETGIDPDSIESAIDLAADPERRVRFQADVQDYVDMGISSTINLPAWGTDLNNEDKVRPFAEMLAEYAPKLRGFTCYPSGSRGGQPLTAVPYSEAIDWEGVEFQDNSDMACASGVCGI